MILITGASGKTGRAVIQALARQGARVRALVRDPKHTARLKELGAQEVVTGDLLSATAVRQAVDGTRAVYHICPNMHPAEVSIARNVLAAAQRAQVEHFVYHSVLHPQTEKMPHHWGKMRVEEMLFESGLPFTILQPTAYMQNILAQRRRILESGVYPVPYSIQAAISLVDLADVAAAAAEVLTTPGHAGATYELVGTEALTQVQVAEALSAALQRPVQAVQLDLEQWRSAARQAGLGDYAIDTLIRMFNYYDAYGLVGNAHALTWLLNRPPTSLEQFIRREFTHSYKETHHGFNDSR